MKVIRRILLPFLTAVALAGFTLPASAIAATSSASHPTHQATTVSATARSGHEAISLAFNDWENYGYAGFAWNNGSYMADNITVATDMSAAVNCNSGWCEHQSSGGDCLTYVNGDSIQLRTCTGSFDQEWSSQGVSGTGGGLLYENEGVSSGGGCSDFGILEASGVGQSLKIYCWNGTSGVPTNATWILTSS